MKKWLAEDWEFTLTALEGGRAIAAWASNRATGLCSNTGRPPIFARGR